MAGNALRYSPLSYAGLTRVSINLRKSVFSKKMDGAIKPRHDGLYFAKHDSFFALQTRLIVIGFALNPCNIPSNLEPTRPT